tara:strand:- start:742 stop:897 length:156 start_codon:yes stop_codon:yes gene_type:complete
MLVCLFHLTEYLIYRKIWGRNIKVLPHKKFNQYNADEAEEHDASFSEQSIE